MHIGKRIKRLMKEKQISNIDMAAYCEVTPGAVSNWITSGKISKSNAVKAATLLKTDLSELISGEPYPNIQTATDWKVRSPETTYATASPAPILVWQYEHDLPQGDFVFIPRLEVRLSAGTGHEQLDIASVKSQPQAFRADWIRKNHLKPKALMCMSADGPSMEPRITHGDSLVIDTSDLEVRDGKIYALWYDGGERVKRLFRLPDGGLRVQSDNPAHPTLTLTREQAEHVRIIGRVVHLSGEGGL
jgi:phage repressor protein C with HTH and peptisase S24 domain